MSLIDCKFRVIFLKKRCRVTDKSSAQGSEGSGMFGSNRSLSEDSDQGGGSGNSCGGENSSFLAASPEAS